MYLLKKVSCVGSDFSTLCAIVCVMFTLTDLAHYEASTIMHTGKIRRFNKVAIVVIVKGVAI